MEDARQKQGCWQSRAPQSRIHSPATQARFRTNWRSSIPRAKLSNSGEEDGKRVETRPLDSCYSSLMEINVKIPDELIAQAKARGLRVEAYIEELLARQLEARPQAAPRARTPEEIRAWLDSLAQFSDKIPPLPETISREWIYQEHN